MLIKSREGSSSSLEQPTSTFPPKLFTEYQAKLKLESRSRDTSPMDEAYVEKPNTSSPNRQIAFRNFLDLEKSGNMFSHLSNKLVTINLEFWLQYRISFFRRYEVSLIRRVASLLKPCTFTAKQILYYEGDRADCLYILYAGTLKLY